MSITFDGDRDGLLAITDQPESETWASLVDATAGVATPTGAMLRIPGWAIPTITWWWATSEASADQPRITERAEQRINRAAQRADSLQEILIRPIESWTWPLVLNGPDGPVTFESPADLGFVREMLGFHAVQVARLAGGGDGLNCSVPGSGKTAVALACLAALFGAGAITRAVVVAPISAHEAWETEPSRCFAPGREPNVSILPDRPDAQIVVYNYEALQDPETLATLKAWLSASPSAAVFDEGHRAKAGRDGVRGLACLEISALATHRYVLTGTPAPNRPSDLEAMFDLVWPGQGHSLVRHTHRNHCFVRATKSMLGLPPMVTTIERVPMSSAHEQLYRAARGVAAL
jgi:hypothetical protein